MKNRPYILLVFGLTLLLSSCNNNNAPAHSPEIAEEVMGDEIYTFVSQQRFYPNSNGSGFYIYNVKNNIDGCLYSITTSFDGISGPHKIFCEPEENAGSN